MARLGDSAARRLHFYFLQEVCVMMIVRREEVGEMGWHGCRVGVR